MFLERFAFLKWNGTSEDTAEMPSATASEPSTWLPDMASSAHQKWIPVAWRLKMKLKRANTRLALINCIFLDNGLAFMSTDVNIIIIGFVKANSKLRKMDLLTTILRC